MPSWRNILSANHRAIEMARRVVYSRPAAFWHGDTVTNQIGAASYSIIKRSKTAFRVIRAVHRY